MAKRPEEYVEFEADDLPEVSTKVPKLCEKCKGEVVDDGIRISHNIKYSVMKCTKCKKEYYKLIELVK